MSWQKVSSALFEGFAFSPTGEALGSQIGSGPDFGQVSGNLPEVFRGLQNLPMLGPERLSVPAAGFKRKENAQPPTPPSPTHLKPNASTPPKLHPNIPQLNPNSLGAL